MFQIPQILSSSTFHSIKSSVLFWKGIDKVVIGSILTTICSWSKICIFSCLAKENLSIWLLIITWEFVESQCQREITNILELLLEIILDLSGSFTSKRMEKVNNSPGCIMMGKWDAHPIQEACRFIWFPLFTSMTIYKAHNWEKT